ncbi:MAG: hypothetical protein UT12_C0019G0012 [Candidatus Curtissbacteria bacterium GW2011_GWC2_38_9]|uniref:Uncharacterized protein n=3 Tax=Candidatus Curtissiibacteriota TaxID=1752717 RepID=A0A1F5HSV4_9BACT|nr:MAG: hypothetical protein UT12_C0019G0012 [Candidatus Curtissbacteria bacterium GW2011_GWC2_38_9]KKS03263.1 MAG: hypothetical protein UU56_C0021G0011 [Candidatus Curtissbacteria bacterium GW2011_GWA2_41_24]OGD90073.1 MAG: hypothetical protein A2Z54_02720 [Candidatus Curtissbacteria bacterium RIFCSPHIGHO2_02_39_8]OGE07217.1 MAG: hypothetical protein A2W70_02165 [Candidatus Curtissbacteria bacterium RIFCSPLOWO2_02_41_11]
MLDIIVQDKIDYWVHAHCTDDLEETLLWGWKGLDDYSDTELRQMIDEQFDLEQVKENLKCSRERHDWERKQWEESEKELERYERES